MMNNSILELVVVEADSERVHRLDWSPSAGLRLLRIALIVVVGSFGSAAFAEAPKQDPSNSQAIAAPRFALLGLTGAVLVIGNVGDCHFVVKLIGEKITPLEANTPTLVVDGLGFEVAVTPPSAADTQAEAEALRAYVKDELAHAQRTFGARIISRIESFETPAGTKFVYWEFDVPKGVGSKILKRMLVTTVSKGHLITIGTGVVRLDQNSAAVAIAKLKATAATIRFSADPIHPTEEKQRLLGSVDSQSAPKH